MSTQDIPTLYNFWQWILGDKGKPFVSEEKGVRSLSFSMMAVQSSMRLSNPYELKLSYTQTMMGFLLFNDDPRHILIVGLGGGSLSKYCYQQFPQTKITTLEISAEVIALRDEFLIPPDDERFQVIHTDAADYLANNDIRADIIMLDGFDTDGLPDCLSSLPFYTNCWRALGAHGVLVSNLLGCNQPVSVYLQRLHMLFNDQVWRSKALDSSNMIAFAVKNNDYSPHWPGLLKKADALAERYQLNFSRIVKNMRKHQLQVQPSIETFNLSDMGEAQD
jgi:spermidine synthase